MNEVRSASNSATMASTLNSSCPTGSSGSCTRAAAEVELDVPTGELSAIARASGQRAGEPVELGHHELVAGAARRERLAEPGPLAARAGERWST
jgi:hypothetical protein